ncbi:MAG TPA: DUF1501 domain-containing protein, partial [Urbifossiella sp.]
MLPFSRRDMLSRCGTGLGLLALAALEGDANADRLDPLAPRPPHFPAKAKHLVHFFMNGGPSQ